MSGETPPGYLEASAAPDVVITDSQTSILTRPKSSLPGRSRESGPQRRLSGNTDLSQCPRRRASKFFTGLEVINDKQPTFPNSAGRSRKQRPDVPRARPMDTRQKHCGARETSSTQNAWPYATSAWKPKPISRLPQPVRIRLAGRVGGGIALFTTGTPMPPCDVVPAQPLPLRGNGNRISSVGDLEWPVLMANAGSLLTVQTITRTGRHGIRFDTLELRP